MQYSNVSFEVIDYAKIFEASENITTIEFINLGNTKFVINDSLILDGRNEANGVSRIKLEAGEGRVFENNFIVRDYCDNLQCYLFEALIIKTVLR